MNSFIGLLTIVLVIFKILGYIQWSWWLVFSPVIGSVAFSILFFILIFVLGAMGVTFKRS